jgi:hypothetical protein
MENKVLNIDLGNFDTIEELVAQKELIPFISKYVNEIRNNRIKREPAKPGYHYKRDAIDAMMDEGELNYNFMIEYFPHIYHKISSMPSARREIVAYITSNAIKDFLETLKFTIKVGDYLNVDDHKAKMQVLDITDETIKVLFRKKRVVYAIPEFVNNVYNKNFIPCSQIK